MQIEYVARVCFTSWRTAQQQGHCTVCNSVFRQVVVYAQNVFALIHEVFSHGYARVRSQVLQRSGVSSSSSNDDGVFHSAVLFKSTNNTSNVRSLLADSYINADNAQAFLVDNGVDCNCSLTGTTVADDKFALTTSDRNKCVDTFNTSLQRGINGFTICDTMCRRFNRTTSSSSDFAFAVDRVTDSANYTAQQVFTNRNLHDAAGTTNYVAFFNLGLAAHQYDTNAVRVQVQNHAGYVVRQFN